MKSQEPKIIHVYDNNTGKKIGMCTLTKAELLVQIKRGEWISKGSSLRLLQSKQSLQEEAQKIIERENRTCYICGKVIPENERATIDHVIPRKSKHYLAYEENNKRCCCQRCNSDKADKTLSAYISYIENNKSKYPYMTKSRIKKLKEYAQQHERVFMFDELKKMGIYRGKEAEEDD